MRLAQSHLAWRPVTLIFVLVSLAAVLPGCTSVGDYLRNGFKVGPNYAKPQAPIGQTWIDAADPRVSSAANMNQLWWGVFGDPVLDALVAKAYQQNFSLKEAAFHVLAERAKLAIAVGEIFPQTQQAFFNYARKSISGNIANSQFTPTHTFNIVDLGFNLTWELDIWGRLRRNVEAADATFNATIDDYDGVLVTLIADVAQTYAQIRTVQSEIVYTKKNIDLQTKTLVLVTERFEGGAVSKLDVTQATQNLADTEALLPPLLISLRQANDRLCVLLGIPMEDLMQMLGDGAIPTPPLSVAVGIPADLLRSRPDVRSAERQLAAQSARIGVAEAQLYPTLAISGTLGTMGASLSDLLGPGSNSSSWGPSVRWDILNYGRLLNQVRVQDDRFQELAMSYFNKVLTADEEVENALALFLQSQSLVKSLERAEAAAKESVDIALVQYRDGKTDYIRVFVIERELVQQQNALAKAKGDLAQGLIAVYRALGGGWQIRCGPPADVECAVQQPAVVSPPRAQLGRPEETYP